MKFTDIIPSNDGGNVGDLWDSIEAADEFKPLPTGIYVCHIIEGKLFESRSRTPGYKLTFKVLEPSEYAGRLLWLDCWLTAAAMPQSKRDLRKLGITSPAQLENPLPRFIRCKVNVALRKDDDGTERNRVKSFDMIGFDKELPDPFAPIEATEAINQDANEESAGNV